MYLVTFIGCIRVLLWSDGRLKSWSCLNIEMLVPAILMFVFATLDVAFGLRHNIVAFIKFNGDPIDEFANTANWLVYMKMVNYVGQSFIGDSILIYRCWIVYGRQWLVIAVPGFMWIGGTVCGILTAYTAANLKNNSDLLNARNLMPFITSMISLSLATNLLTTSLIVWKIWSIERAVKYRASVSERTYLTRVKHILIESGLMYTVSVVILFGLYIASNNGQFGVSNSVVQIIGITFNLIITRVDRGESTQPASSGYQSHKGETRSVPLHAIHVQTHTRFPVNETPDRSANTTPEPKSPKGWV